MVFRSRFVLLLCFCVFLFHVKSHAQLTLTWEKNYGGSANDFLNSVIHTHDGGYLLVGHSGSSDFDCDTSYGSHDFFVIKTDSVGQVVWKKNFGGSDWDAAYSVVQTNSHDFILAGRTLSTDYDISFSHGNWDIWAIKIDSIGNLIWEKTYGGSAFEGVWDIAEVTPNSFLLAGYSSSQNDDLGAGFGQIDAVVLKIDSLGNLIWLTQFGGNNNDILYDLEILPNGDVVAVGSTNSDNGQIVTNYGGTDAWVVWIDAQGNLISNKTYGGSLTDGFQNVLLLDQGNLLFTGTSSSSDNDVTNNYGQEDFWVVKADSQGTILWQKNYGGSGIDIANKSIAANITDYIICGYSSSSDVDVNGNYGGTDFWLLQINTLGQPVQQNHFGTSLDEGGAIYFVDSAKFLLYGSSEGSDYDIAANYGIRDYWLANFHYQSLVGIEPAELPTIRFGFPSPAADVFCFSLGEQEQVENLFLYDLTGHLIGKPSCSTDGEIYMLQTNALPNGLYILSVHTTQTRFLMQMVVVH
jgi:hypothetical protein